jgi:ribosome-associated protein
MADKIPVAGAISLDAAELEMSFIHGSGPGGQNVNKVSTTAQLRFDLRHSPSLPDGLKARAARLAGTRLTREGEIVITAGQFRTQALNRADAIARLVELLADAAVPPKPRRATRPTLASKTRRLEGKAHHSGVKRLRGDRTEPD